MIYLVKFVHIPSNEPVPPSAAVHTLADALAEVYGTVVAVLQSAVEFLAGVAAEYPLIALGLVAILLAVMFILPR